MIEITTYIQRLKAQGGVAGKCFGVRSSSYGGYIKNDAFVYEMIFGREDELSAKQRSWKLGADGFLTVVNLFACAANYATSVLSILRFRLRTIRSTKPG